ncbi:hypothetical protein ACIRJS_39980 [Streptomyces sp. NPDC102340]|uniref:hypothetical protein n=1 Tax=unclassified Streptomyces TaxID=2593676 RepID=UPI002E26DF14
MSDRRRSRPRYDGLRGSIFRHAQVATTTIRDLYIYVRSTLADVEGVLHIETSLTGPYLKHARTIRTSEGVNKVLPRNN